jgi:hypothetical protein
MLNLYRPLAGPTAFSGWVDGWENRDCTALLKAEFFIDPPPDTQRIRRRGERGIGVARSSYLFLTSLPSPLPPPPPHRASVAPPGAALSGLAERRLLPLPTALPPMAKTSDFQGFRPKVRTASV